MPQTHLSDELLAKLNNFAPSGFVLVRNVRMTDRNKDIINHFPVAWRAIYDAKGYAMGDPVVLWSAFNIGSKRWSDINILDYRNVLTKAKSFGLNFGAVVSRRVGGRHSILSVSRSTSDYTDDEIAYCANLLDEAMAQMEHDTPLLKPTEIEVLRHLAEGLTLEDSAQRSGVAISTVKNRLTKARETLGAKTSVQAVAESIRRKLI